jgi:exodeoxyribonuclease-5
MLTKEQNDAVHQLLKYRHRDQVQSLGGLAGTGKTTCMAVLADALPEFAVCAYTGKACHVLRRKGVGAVTIHNLIYQPTPTLYGGAAFQRKPRHEIGCQGILIDEASMVSKQIYDDLCSYGLPIIFVGDHGQLPPVGSDVHVMADPDYRLETIHRNAAEIAHFAQHIRKGKLPRKFPAQKRVHFVNPDRLPNDTLLSADQVICAFNQTRVGINKRVRRLLGRKQLIEPGDRLICLRNHRNAGLFNGQQFTVEHVHDGCQYIDLLDDDGREYADVAYDPRQFGQERYDFKFDPDTPHPFDYAHAITCHKSQGSEWNRVLVFEQHCRHWEQARWAYTAASRARRRLFWVPGAPGPLVRGGWSGHQRTSKRI